MQNTKAECKLLTYLQEHKAFCNDLEGFVVSRRNDSFHKNEMQYYCSILDFCKIMINFIYHMCKTMLNFNKIKHNSIKIEYLFQPATKKVNSSHIHS